MINIKIVWEVMGIYNILCLFKSKCSVCGGLIKNVVLLVNGIICRYGIVGGSVF